MKATAILGPRGGGPKTLEIRLEDIIQSQRRLAQARRAVLAESWARGGMQAGRRSYQTSAPGVGNEFVLEK